MRRFPVNLFRTMLFFVTVGRIHNVDRGESSSVHSRITRYENITKGANDTYSYRGLKLDNDLKILLVSSPKITHASVTMSIKVGHLNDFDELPGITNLVGEMVNRFGISSNPEQEFVEIIHSRLPGDVLDEATFPDTKEDEQLFRFEINSTYLTPALKIFAQLFNDPLLMFSNSRGPLRAGIRFSDWWHSSVALSEGGNKWRFWQIAKSISAEAHPFNHAPYGTTETFNKYLVTPNESQTWLDSNSEPLPTILHDKIREFYSTWYSSNLMCLVVFGRESLDQLERVVVPLFETIPNKQVEKLHFPYEKHAWGEEQLRHKIYTAFNAQSLIKEEVVRLVFRVPDIRYQYRTGPEMYVRYILMRGGPGSLFFLLEEKKLCSRIKASYEVKAGIGFFIIKCKVPEENEMNEDEIVKLIIQYIHFIRKHGIHKWIFDEIREHKKVSFVNSPFMFSNESLASTMQEYPIEDVLSYKFRQDEWKPELIKEFLKYLTPENMNVFIDSTKFQDVIEEQNKWHNLPYKVEKIPHQLIEDWNKIDLSLSFQIPAPNEFLAANLDIQPLEKNEPENPYVVHETPRSRFWFSQDDRSANVRVKFNLIDLEGHVNPSGFILFCIFRNLLSYLMIEYKYALYASAYEWTFTPDENSLNIQLFGYSNKMQIAVTKIVSKITVDQLAASHLKEQFEKAKVECVDRENDRENSPSAMQRLKYVLTESSKSWSPHEITAASQSLQFEDWYKFISKLLSRVFIQGLIVGNCVEQTAIKFAKIIETSFVSSAQPIPQEMLGLLPRVVEINGGEHFVDISLKETEDRQHHIQSAYYQFGPGNNRNIIISSLLLNVIKEICHDVIPNDIITQYSNFRVHGVIGLFFWTISQNHDAHHIDSLFENCLRKVHVSMKEMSNIEFEKQVKVVIENNLSPYLRTSYWDDIVAGLYSFEQEVVDFTLPLSKMDILRFFENTLYESSPNRRKCTILTFPKDSDWESLSLIPGTTKIEDLMTFKNNSNLLPFPQPFIRVNFS